MKNAPLVYTIGMLQFTRIPNIAQFVDKFMNSIRHEYPLEDRDEVSSFNANIAIDGVKMERQQTQLWQFSSVDRKWGFVLSDCALCLHTNNYHDFHNFFERFEKGIVALGNIPEINLEWMTSIGFRYVNMVTPRPKESLGNYLHPWILPNDPPKGLLKMIQGIYAVRYKTKSGELRIQSLRNPIYTLPPELNSSFLIKNEWINKRPKSEFALVDIDHGTTWPEAIPFNPKKALNSMKKLREGSKSIFESMRTPFAKKVWS